VQDYRADTGIEWHEAEEVLFGIPQNLAFMQDRIFEGLPLQEAKKWTVRFFEAIPQNADLTKVIDNFMWWVLTNPEGIIKNTKDFLDVSTAIIAVADLYALRLAGSEPNAAQWESAAESAESAAESAAWSAARSAESAAEGARSAVYIQMANKLIELIQHSPVK
jgi:hypothetical protein